MGTRPETEVVGFCLAAGAGSRLAPLTRRVPKPLLAPAGRPLVELACEALLAAGAGRVVVNAHHGADLLAGYLDGRALRARGGVAACRVVREPELLGTGGGLGNARRLGLLGRGIVLVTCADVVVHPSDLAALAGLLERPGAQLAAGLVPARDDPLPLRLDHGRIAFDPAGTWASAGVYAVRAPALDAIPPGSSTLAGSLLEPLCRRGQARGWPLGHPWADAGTLGRFLAVSSSLLAGCWPARLPPGRLLHPGGPGRGLVLVVDGAVLAPGAVVAGPAVLDAASRVGPGAVVTRAVVGPGASVGAGATVTGSVLGPTAVVEPGATVTAALLP